MKKITIDGVEYTLDFDTAVKSGYLKKKVVHKVGNNYRKVGGMYGGQYQVLAILDGKVALIGLNDGRQWTTPKTVKNVDDITADEFAQIAFGTPEAFVGPLKISVTDLPE